MEKSVKKISLFAMFLALLAALTITARAENDVEIEVTETESQKVIGIADSVTNMAAIGQKLGRAYGEIMQFAKRKSIELTGYPVAITLEFDEENYDWTFLAGMPFNPENDFIPSGRIQVYTLPGGKVVKATMTGPYDQSEQAYIKISEYIDEHGLEENGNSWEVYLNDPQNTPPEELKTLIYFPVK
jgi:effector-binding domain-containing protein